MTVNGMFYAFQTVSASIIGPGGNVAIAYGSGAAEEGLTIEPMMAQSTLKVGADGSGTHSLSASTAHTIKVRLSQASPSSRALQLMANIQRLDPLLNGKNVIVLRDILNFDVLACEFVSFAGWTPVMYAKESGVHEWSFEAIKVQRL